MRILLTTDTAGGVWTFTATLASGLLDQGHSVSLLSLGGLPSSAQLTSLEQIERSFGSRFCYQSSEAGLEWMAENDQCWSASMAAIQPILRRFRPDLLHSSQFCFGRLHRDLPVLVTAHSDVLSWAESTLAPCGLQKLEATAKPSWLAEYRRIVSDGLAQAGTLTAPTQWLANAIERLYALRRPLLVVSNGLGHPAERARSPEVRRLQAITAGRFTDPGKGLAILHDLESPIPILIAGDLPAGLLPARARQLGPVAHSHLLRYFRQSSIYLTTSLYEPFGLAALEAAQAGCAILARNIASLREVWADGALYFDSAASLQMLLNALNSDAHLLADAQQRCYQRAQRYSAEAQTSAYLALYQQMLNGSPISAAPAMACG